MTANDRTRSSKILAKALSVSAGVSLLALIVFVVSACSPPGAPLKLSQTSFANSPNETGYQGKDGKQHTGASADRALEKVKNQIAAETGTPDSVSKIDSDLAKRILSANFETVAPATLRIHVSLRDTGILTFDFTDKEIAARSEKDAANEVRYKMVTGKTADGAAAGFELAMLCRKAAPEAGKPAQTGCNKATLAIKEIRSGGAKAGVVLRSQTTTVLAKSPATSIKHETLKRLISDLKTPKLATMQSFEVAWGPSGFAVNFGDSQICPVGRLVETNELDEPLKLNCPGISALRDLEGRMIGNTTRGELFLEIIATTPGMIYGETVENVYLLIQQKREPKKTAPKAGGTTGTTTGGATADAPKTPDADDADDEDDDDDEPIFQSDRKAEAPAPKLPGTAGWLIPVNTGDAFTKTFASDRKNPIIAAGVQNWLKSDRLKKFALHFLPNKKMVFGQLGTYSVPPEFALITMIESRFFVDDGYPIQAPPNSSAWGMWQFLDDTASGNGLRIFPRLVNKKLVPGNICDERANLERATLGAGRYLRSIIEMFPNDPKLVVLGYTMGEFGLQKKVSSIKNSSSRLGAIKDIGLNFWAIRKFQMAKAHQIKYVQDFVSIYHAALEMAPMTSNVAPWKPNPACR